MKDLEKLNNKIRDLHNSRNDFENTVRHVVANRSNKSYYDKALQFDVEIMLSIHENLHHPAFTYYDFKNHGFKYWCPKVQFAYEIYTEGLINGN